MTTRVLYIGAAGRSGSTLLDRIIGQLPGFVSAGEINDIVRAGLFENRSCGCGLRFQDCAFWLSVGELAFGGWERVDERALAAAGRTSYAMTLSEHVRPGNTRVRKGHELLGRLYAAISMTADGATVVDSSKSPNYAAFLASVPELNVRIVHLVRDSRGVAYSWTKKIRRPDVPGREVEMLRLGVWQASARWIVQNSMIELVSRHIPSFRVRYEDLVAAPAAKVPELLAALGIPGPRSSFDFIDGKTVRLAANHTVMGNPMRMRTGAIDLLADEEWRVALTGPAKLAVTACTWPLLARYGYSATSRLGAWRPSEQGSGQAAAMMDSVGADRSYAERH